MIAELAERQHGVVSRAQLGGLGLSRRAVEHRVDQGRLHVVQRGVYAVGHRLLPAEGRWMAAVLASGTGAVLSHRSAATLWGIRRTDRAAIEVTAPGCGRGRPGVERHRSLLAIDEVTSHRRIPVTTVPRTLLDLAAVLDASQLKRAVNEADVLRLGDRLTLADLALRYPRRSGTAQVRTLLADRSLGATITRRELEKRFQELVAEADLPRPQTNAWVEAGAISYEVDCVWRAQWLALELDGRATHLTLTAFEADRARDRALQVAGWRTVRVTWRQLHEERAAVAADLRALLGAPASGRAARTTVG